MLKALDINWLRGKRDLKLTLNGEAWDVGIREGQYDDFSGTMRTQANGQIIEGVNFWNGALEIAHSNCIVRSCYFRNLNFHTLYQLAGVSDALVELCTFDGRPDGAVVNASNSDFVFAHNRPLHLSRSVFLDASNDSLNFVGGTCEKNLIIGGGFTAGAHADAISVHTTVVDFIASKNYIDYRQRPGAVIPNACIKYVSVPSIGQGQNAGNGIAHKVACYDSVCLGGGYTMYLDSTKASLMDVQRNIVDWAYWYSDDRGDVFPPVISQYKNNKNCADVGEDYVSIAQNGDVGPDPEPEPEPDDEIAELWAAIDLLTQNQKADHDRLEALIANLHKA